MQEPILHFYTKYGINTSEIQEIVCGRKYVALLLKNGNIGVCATLNSEVNVQIEDLNDFNVDLPSHRIVVTAYFNALFNYDRVYAKQLDIFDEIDFNKYKNIIMIGYFGSLTDKFKKESINLSVFDLKNNGSHLVDIQKQNEFLKKADIVILTSTSVQNNTFVNIINSTTDNCKIFTLGPSTILHPDMFCYHNIHTIFGSIFNSNDKELLDIVGSGGGTKRFLHLMNKVCFEN